MNSSMAVNGVRFSALANVPDEALIAHLAAGNHDALAVLFDRYQSMVLRVAMQVLRNPHEAEEVLQSVFLELMRTAAKFDPAKGTARGWLLQHVYHRAFDRRRYLNRRGAYDLTEGSEINDPALTEEVALGAMDAARLVQEAMAHLNKAQRTTIEMAFFEGLTMQEIAEKTGETFASVRHHYYRGLQKMRLVLGPHAKSGPKESAGGEAAYV